VGWGVACGDAGSTAGGGGTGGAGGAGGAEVCDGHAVAGPTSFEQRTEAWGLAGVVGGRVMSGDVNGDGYPDLLVHGFAPNVREEIGSDVRRVFLLVNEPADGGGRTFVDRTYESGFAAPVDGSTTELKASHLAVLGDVDNDGDLDVFSGTYTDEPAGAPTPADLDRSEIYLNDGAGNFTVLQGSGVAFETERRTSSATFADVNRDGVLDLFVGVHYTTTGSLQRPALFLGQGDGTFEDATSSYGVDEERRATFGVTSCDLDDNGYPELLMSAYARGPNVLYTLTESGFVDVGESAGFAYDDDQDFTDNQFFLCWCTANPSAEECQGVDSPAVQCPTPAGSNWGGSNDTEPDRLGGNTFSTVCADIDGDGRLDLYDAQIVHWWAGGSSDPSTLLLNTSEAPTTFSFARPPRDELGLDVPQVGVDWNEGGIVAAVGDLDGDARQDLLLGTSDYPDQFSWIFRQREDRTFEEVGEAIGLHHPCAVGTTVADFDRDGDLDVVVASGTARDCAEIWTTNEVHLYENRRETSASWLAVRLDAGDAGDANRAAIGARVTVTAGGVSQTQELTSGYGHFGLQNDTVLYFHLGDCVSAAEVQVVWPNQTRETTRYDRVRGGRLVELRRGEAEPLPILGE
jgi:enediyne biosynthesis protein E4